jgi:hypothetical protein
MKRKSITDFPTATQIEDIIETESEATDLGGEAFLRKYLDRGVEWFKELFWRLSGAGEKDLLYEISQALRTPEFKDLSPALSGLRAMRIEKPKVVRIGVRLIYEEGKE